MIGCLLLLHQPHPSIKNYRKETKAQKKSGLSKFFIMWLEELIETKVEDEYISFASIYDIFISKYGAIPLKDKDIPSLKMHYYNAFHSLGNEEKALKKEDLNIRAFSLPMTEQTKPYTDGNYVEEKVGPYLAYEEEVNYYYSNSERLFLEVTIARGVTEEDKLNNTEKYNRWKRACVQYWNISGIEIGDNLEEWKKTYWMDLE